MVYIKIWTDFQREAEALYAKSPVKTRYCVKWRALENKVVLKVTDDTTCLKYKTSSSYHFQKFLSLNLSIMEKMQNRRLSTVAPATTLVSDATIGSPRPGTPVAGGATGVGRKKGGKRKK